MIRLIKMILKLFGLNGRTIFNVKKSLALQLLDWSEALLNEKDESYPPYKHNFVGTLDFKAVGFEFLRYFIEFGKLKPSDHVLDIGCGIGRMAIPLTNYLKQGTYNGIDVVPKGIEWCSSTITKKYPNFIFQLADVHNKTYNPHGTVKPSQYTFPFSDNAFDFILLTSVFTHLVPDDAFHYLDEISRMLKAGGRLFSSWFLLNAESVRLINEKKSSIAFNFSYNKDPNILIADPTFPEDAIAYSEALIRERFTANHLRLDEKTYYGKWCNRVDFISFQDILVATKT